MADNPFSQIARENADHAYILAMAFRVAHEMSDVHAALRFERSVRMDQGGDGRELHGYIYGCYLESYALDSDGDESDLADVRDLARAYLESLRRVPQWPGVKPGSMPRV